MISFCDPKFLLAQGPRGLTKQLERLLWHLRFTDVVNIDGPGDGGGDVVAQRDGRTYVFQTKWHLRSNVGEAAVDEVFAAMGKYDAHFGVIVTNRRLSSGADRRIRQLALLGARLQKWEGDRLLQLYQAADVTLPPFELYGYQQKALESVWGDLTANDRSLLFLATGLGKTVVAGEVLRRYLNIRPDEKVLVVAHARDLVDQLERAMWRHIPKTVRTQLVNAESRPDDLSGVTFATLPTALHYARRGYKPGLVVVDEAHHVGGDGQYAELLDLLRGAKQLGVTATPWRGDKFDITDHFGLPSASVGISEGMRRGYLADVRYRLFADNIDWDFVRNHSEHSYTLKDLNARLFVPQRDEAIRSHLLETWNRTRNPRAIVFCRSIEHGERLAQLLSGIPQWARVLAIHGGLTKRERQTRLLQFRSGVTPIVTAVDLLNEGVDVPDVNILCFARVTHSRRIFIQQLGRGLRLRKGKSHVEVLDFVSDLRRLAAIQDLRESVRTDEVDVVDVDRNQFIFNDQRVESLMREWIEDVADLEDAADQYRLEFPPLEGL
jgi:superfamily II DNA or RNA helicase